MTDRIARRPHGREARETYGADDVHSFAWPPVLAALAARARRPAPRRRLRRRRLPPPRARGRPAARSTGLDHSRDMVRLAARTSGVASCRRGRRSCRSRTARSRPFRRSSRSSSSPIRLRALARDAARPRSGARPARDLHDGARGEGNRGGAVPARDARPLLLRRGARARSRGTPGFSHGRGRAPRRVGPAARGATLSRPPAVETSWRQGTRMRSRHRWAGSRSRATRSRTSSARRHASATASSRWRAGAGFRDRPTRGIEIGGNGDGVTIDLHVVVEYGLNLAEVASTVRNRVGYEVDRLTGLPVRAVEVHIDDVRRTG